LPDASFDAVCVAQALHWFDLDRFYAEVKRVLRPRGVLLVAGYTWTHVSPEFDSAVKHVVLDPIRALWPRQSSILSNGYREIPFPFEPVDLPPLAIEMDWTLDQFLAYIATWTALRKRLESEPEFLERARPALAQAWGREERRKVSMPLHVRCGRHA
jgi:SAM-dependent methyltransferase